MNNKNALDNLRKLASDFRSDVYKRDEVDYVLEIADEIEDELKAMNDRLQVALDAVEGCDERCKQLEAERDELDAFAKRLECAAHDKLGVTLFGVDYVTEEFMLHVRDTLTAERDEWKAKAESVLHENPYVGLVRGKQWERIEISDYYCGRCGWKVTDHDSYCPECGGALHKTSNKPDSKFDARKTAETPETDAAKGDIRDFDADSREKLEADIEKRAVHAETILGPLRIGTVKVGTNVIHGWLDRQAEITKREWAHVNDMYIADVRAERDAAESRAAELEAEISKRDKGIERLKRQRDEARAQLENLARDLAECGREREIYRDACGRLLDLADQMRLVRLDGCCTALVDDEGEVVS